MTRYVRSTYAEPIGQPMGQFKVVFVRAFASVALTALERSQQCLAILFVQQVLSHREKAMILLVDMVTQQSSVGVGVGHEFLASDMVTGLCRLNRGGHYGQVAPALLVFLPHDRGRADIVRQSTSLQ